MSGGAYVLFVAVADRRTVEVGALGRHTLAAGGYAYVGSALGPGGYARLERHRRVAAGTHDVRHWHVDHLLGADGVRVVGDVRVPGRDVECRLAAGLEEGVVPGFGCSDCGCRTHLFRGGAELRRRAESLAAELR